MQLQLVAVFCVFAALLGFSVENAAAATTVRPYEFGFRLDDYSQQHRSEKRDERGIVMGEFGFITADGIYHVTVYATDEEGKFRILAMRNFPYEKQPKTIDMVVAAKPKPAVISTTAAAPPKKTLPAFNFAQEACSGCFLTNKTPKQTPAAKKTEIRTLSQSLPPSPPSENSITGTGAGKELVSKALPKVLNNLKHVAQAVQSPIRPTIEDTVGIAQLERVRSKTPKHTQPKKTTTTPTTFTQYHPQTAESQVRFATAIVSKDSLGKAQIQLTAVTNKSPNLVRDNLGQPQRRLTDVNAPAASNIVAAKLAKPVAVATPPTRNLTAQKNAATDNLGQPQRRLTTVPNALPSQPSLTKTNNNLAKDNIGNPQRRLTTINTRAPAAAARITTGNSRPGAVFGQPPKPQTTLNKKALIPPTHTTQAQKKLQAGKVAAALGGKLTPNTNVAKTQPGKTFGAGLIDLRIGDAPQTSFSPSAKTPAGLPKANAAAAPSAAKPKTGAAGAAGFGGGKPAAAAGDAGDLYRFKYTLDYNGHQEKGSRNGDKQGSFFSIGDDNIERTIEYIANEFGFQPRIRWRKLDAPVKPKENALKDYEFVWFKE